MCDFKPGDEVVCVRDDYVWNPLLPKPTVYPKIGDVDVVRSLHWDDQHGLYLELERFPGEGWDAAFFRKVQRRDLSAWLEAATDFEEPKRLPERVRA